MAMNTVWVIAHEQLYNDDQGSDTTILGVATTAEAAKQVCEQHEDWVERQEWKYEEMPRPEYYAASQSAGCYFAVYEFELLTGTE